MVKICRFRGWRNPIPYSSIDVVAAWRAACDSSTFCRLSVADWVNFLLGGEVKVGRAGKRKRTGHTCNKRHLGGSIVIVFKLGKHRQPYAPFFCSILLHVQFSMSLLEQPANLDP